MHCNQGTLPGLQYTFLNGFFPKVGFFRSFSYPRDAPFQLLLAHDLNVNKTVTVSTKAPITPVNSCLGVVYIYISVWFRTELEP